MQKIIASLTVALAVGLAVLAPSAFAQQGSHSGQNHEAPPKTKDVSAAEVAKPGELAEVVLGKADAPITIIEYASITCGHCGHFHREMLPKLKAKYIDTGVAKLYIREFPLESVAAASSMLARCAGPSKTYEVIETLFERQQKWLAGNDVRNALVAIMKEHGMDEAGFTSCLEDRALLKKISGVRDRGNREFGVNSTPTFFINGKALVGPRSIDEFTAIIEPMRKK